MFLASFYDTTAEDAFKITWHPYSLAQNPYLSVPSPKTGLTLQYHYLASFQDPEKFPYDASSPMEYYLSAELSNPHSRAKKQARWKERIEAREQVGQGRAGAHCAPCAVRATEPRTPFTNGAASAPA